MSDDTTTFQPLPLLVNVRTRFRCRGRVTITFISAVHNYITGTATRAGTDCAVWTHVRALNVPCAGATKPSSGAPTPPNTMTLTAHSTWTMRHAEKTSQTVDANVDDREFTNITYM